MDYGEQDEYTTMLKEGEVLFKLLLRRLFFFIHLFIDNTKKTCASYSHFLIFFPSPHFLMQRTIFVASDHVEIIRGHVVCNLKKTIKNRVI